MDEMTNLKKLFEKNENWLRENATQCENLAEDMKNMRVRLDKSSGFNLAADKKFKQFEDKMKDITDWIGKSDKEGSEKGKLEILEMKDKQEERWNTRFTRIEDKIEKSRGEMSKVMTIIDQTSTLGGNKDDNLQDSVKEIATGIRKETEMLKEAMENRQESFRLDMEREGMKKIGQNELEKIDIQMKEMDIII